MTCRAVVPPADHRLAEAVQGRISTLREAEAWWEQTLAHHQADRDAKVVTDAVDFLTTGGYVTTQPHPSGDADITATELGILTARLMVPTFTGVELRADLAELPVPAALDQAENLLLDLLAVTIPELAEAPIAEELRRSPGSCKPAAGSTGSAPPAPTCAAVSAPKPPSPRTISPKPTSSSASTARPPCATPAGRSPGYPARRCTRSGNSPPATSATSPPG
jgi:helicase